MTSTMRTLTFSVVAAAVAGLLSPSATSQTEYVGQANDLYNDITPERYGHEILLRGTNLTDEEARNHVSVLKDTVPLPGRDIRLTYRLMF